MSKMKNVEILLEEVIVSHICDQETHDFLINYLYSVNTKAVARVQVQNMLLVLAIMDVFTGRFLKDGSVVAAARALKGW